MPRMIRPRPVSSPTGTIQLQEPFAIGVVRVAAGVGEGIRVADGVEVGEGGEGRVWGPVGADPCVCPIWADTRVRPYGQPA